MSTNDDDQTCPHVSDNEIQCKILKILKLVDDKTILFLKSYNSLPPTMVTSAQFITMINELRDTTIHIHNAQSNLEFWADHAMQSLNRAHDLILHAEAYLEKQEEAKKEDA